MEIEVPDKETVREQAKKQPQEMKKEMMDEMKRLIKMGQEKGTPMKPEKQLYKQLRDTEDEDGEMIGNLINAYTETRGIR